MAGACGMSAATVSRIWRAFGLKPHRTETFKLSRDPLFIEEVRDIVGLHLHPPVARGGVVRGREAADSSVGAQPAGAADAPRACGAAHHDYRRHGPRRCLRPWT